MNPSLHPASVSSPQSTPPDRLRFPPGPAAARRCLTALVVLLATLLLPIHPTRAEEFVGDVTRFSPSVGQPLFPVGNINVFKQFAFDFGEKLEVGKKVEVGFATFGAEATGEVAAAMGFEFGVCIGGNSDYDLGFKPRISVPDKIPYEFPLTLHVEQGLMADSKFTTNFPPLGKAYADLIFDVTVEAKFEACVFGCITFTLFSLKTADLMGMTYMNLPLGKIVPAEIAGLFATSVRCDDTIDAKAFTSIELASWNRGEDNKFKMLNVFAKSVEGFLAEPTLEFGGPIESGGGSVFTVDKDTDTLTTGGKKFKSGDAVALKSSDTLPGGLAEKKVYYVVGAEFLGNGDTFKLARRKGGSPLDIKDSGSGRHEVKPNDAKAPGSPKGADFDSFGKISITAPTVSTDSSVSEVDDLVRNFAVTAPNVITMEPKVDLESGLRGFHDGIKVRVAKDGSNALPDGLNPACVYYVINADSSGLQYSLATKVGGPAVEIAVSAVTNKISRSAEFNSIDGLSSTGAEDVAAVTIDVVKLVNEVAFKASPLKIQAVYDLGIASIDYKLISLEVGPAIQLQTDYKLSWDLVVDDVLFREAGKLAEAKVRFVEKVNENAAETDFSSLQKAFPGRVFHMTSLGPRAIPEISLINGDPVCVTFLYHLEPKLKTKVSAPIFGRVKYEALEVGAGIEHVGSLRLGPLIEGEHKFKLGEFTIYDGNPFPLDKGEVEPRTDFDQADDRDRYELILVDETSGESTPDTGCAEVVITKKADGLHLKIFDVEGEVIQKRSKPVSEILSPETALALANELTPWPTPTAEKKAAILKSATKQESLSPGVMSFELKAAGPADYHWQPFTPYDANSESDLAINSDTGLTDDRVYYNTEIDPGTGGTKGYAASGPTGVWQYGYVTSADHNTFKAFLNSSWHAQGGSNFYDTGFFLEDGVFMDPSVSIAKSNGSKWPVRRWISPGGRVDITWGVAMRPGSIALSNTGAQDLTPVPSNGLIGQLYVDGVLQQHHTVTSAASLKQANTDLRFELDIEGYGNEPEFTLRNTGGVSIRQFYLRIGDTRFNFDSVLFHNAFNNGGDVILQSPDSNDDGGSRTDDIIINFASLAPGAAIKFIADFDSDSGNSSENYETILFNNGNDQPNAFATVTGVNNAQTSIRLLDGPDEPSYRFRSTSLPSSRVNMQMMTKTIDLTKGQKVDLVLNPNGDAWQDVAVMTMDITVQGYEWASPPDSPTNWAELLSGNGPHQPNAYPGSLYRTSPEGVQKSIATNWATIDRIDTAPYPSLTLSKTIGTLQIKDSARLNVVPPDGQTASLAVHDGAVANAGTVDVFQAGGTGKMILGGPVVSDTSLTGKGTVKLHGSSLEGWRDPAPSAFSFINYNTIQGSGTAMDLLTTHPATQSSITNMGRFQTESGFLKTSAQRFINRSGLFSQGGTLSVRGENLENRFGSFVGAGGAGATIILAFDEGLNTGYIYANGQGYVQILPGQTRENIWSAGLEDSSEQQGTFLVDDAYMELDSIQVTGGAFVVRNGGLLRTASNRGKVFFTGSNMDIGDFDPDTVDPNSGLLNLTPGGICFTGVAMRNFGEVRVNAGANADVIDSRLFENHGKILVQNIGSLRFREIKDKTVDPNASDVARRSPGLANATGETLLGGTWDIAGELLIDGATITKIGADVQSDTSYGNSYEDDAGVKVGDPVIVDSNTSTAEACALSLCQPAHVIVRGLNASFPALDYLQINCGTFHLLEGAGHDGTRIPSGGEGQRLNGDFVNRGGILVDGGPMVVDGRFTQIGPLAQMSIMGTGEVSSTSNEYFIMGGAVTVGPEARFLSLNAARNGFLPGTKIVVNSPFIRVVRSNAEVTPASVSFGTETVITTIDQGVEVTQHGREAAFPTRMLVSNAGSLTISGDHGLDNHGSADIGYGGDFTNTGRLDILGKSSKVFMYDDFAQSGNDAVTHVGPGAQLRLNRGMQVSGGQIILDIAARPHHRSFYASMGGSNTVNFGDRLVINFIGDFLKVRPDIGDTWEIISRSNSARISGIDTVTYLRDGAPLPADFLPPNSHLEVVQLPVSYPQPRGLAIRVTPDAGWILYDEWLKGYLGNVDFVADYAAHVQPYFFGSNTNTTSSDEGDYQQSLVELDGEEFYQLTYTRRSLVDATFTTYGSTDLKSWSPAPMAVVEIVPATDGSGLETVTLRSTFPLPEHRLFLRVEGTLNLDNAAEGLIPEKPINKYAGSSLRNLERHLIDQVFRIPLERRNGVYHPDDIEAAAQQLPYRIVPGRVLYFQTQGFDNNSVIGGTAADGVTRDYVYMDKSIIGAMMIHAGLVNYQSTGIFRVTILERQPTFIGSTQTSPNGNTRIISKGKTSEAAETDEVFSVSVEGYVDPFGG